MNIESLLKSIKNNNLSSNYLIYGEESFFIDMISSYFIKYTIPESEKVFNQKVFYGKEISIFSLISTLKSFPMMGNRQLVLVKEAHKLTDLSELVNYLTNTVSTTIFVLCYNNKKLIKGRNGLSYFKKLSC